MMDDYLDFTNRYNTVLTPEQEKQFQVWAIEESKKQGRNVLLDLENYDLRGLWNSGGGFGGENNHAVDTFKKPNHPTFSDQSMYDGVDGYHGGVWQETPSGGMRYLADPSNMYSGEALKNYFNRAEKGVELVLPQGGLLGRFAVGGM